MGSPPPSTQKLDVRLAVVDHFFPRCGCRSLRSPLERIRTRPAFVFGQLYLFAPCLYTVEGTENAEAHVPTGLVQHGVAYEFDIRRLAFGNEGAENDLEVVEPFSQCIRLGSTFGFVPD